LEFELTEESLEKLLEAGRIASEARDFGARIVEPGRKASEICERVERLIIEKGARPAFPCNISISEVAAHYTPSIGVDVEIPEDGVVKVDVGAHVDGFIADTAVTVDLTGRHARLLEASREALSAAERILRPGVSLFEIGRTIYTTMKRKGFKPIRNLYGHTIGRYLVHAGISIPNYPERRAIIIRLRPPQLFAIEPFATNGRGHVVESSITAIYSYNNRKPRVPLGSVEERVLDFIVREYKTLPFTPRWLRGIAEDQKILLAIRGLVLKGLLESYPVLVEAGRGLVAQFEHTYLMLKDRIIVTTRGGEEIEPRV
jgi:methionyl aminopeptidase